MFATPVLHISPQWMQQHSIALYQPIVINREHVCLAACDTPASATLPQASTLSNTPVASIDEMHLKRFQLLPDESIQVETVVQSAVVSVSHVNLKLLRLEERNAQRVTWQEEALLRALLQNRLFLLGSRQKICLLGKEVLLRVESVRVHGTGQLLTHPNPCWTLSTEADISAPETDSADVSHLSGFLEQSLRLDTSVASPLRKVTSPSTSSPGVSRPVASRVILPKLTFLGSTTQSVYQPMVLTECSPRCQFQVLVETSGPQGELQEVVELVGLEQVSEYLRQRVQHILGAPGPTAALKNRGYVLCLYGPAGGGKRSLMERLETSVRDSFPVVRVSQSSQVSASFVETISSSTPCLVLLSGNAEKLLDTSKVESVEEFAHAVRRLRSSRPFLMLLSCTDMKNLAAPVRAMISEGILVALPSLQQRVHLLDQLLVRFVSREICRDWTVRNRWEQLAARMPGYSAGDMHEVVALAVDLAQGEEVNPEHLETALQRCRPPHIADAVADYTMIHWDDIVGYDEVKRTLRNIVGHLLPRGENARQGNISSGVLLYGPPGCSKTMFACAMATEFQLNLLSISPADVYHRYVGDSEKRIREVLLRAEACAPSMLFIDEIDKVLPRRNDDSNDVGHRIHTEIMVHVDGIRKDRTVILVGATNRPDSLDPALMRPGRIGHHLYIPLPDETTKLGILRKHLGALGQHFQDVQLTQFAREDMRRFSGAAVVQTVENAIMNRVGVTTEGNSALTLDELQRAAHRIRPTDQADLDFYEKFVSMGFECH